MKTRIHIVLSETEKERFRRRAEQEGKSLAAWLRDAAREKLAADEGRAGMDAHEQLQDFFAACDRRETDREPDWEEHRQVIERSVRSGSSET